MPEGTNVIWFHSIGDEPFEWNGQVLKQHPTSITATAKTCSLAITMLNGSLLPWISRRYSWIGSSGVDTLLEFTLYLPYMLFTMYH